MGSRSDIATRPAALLRQRLATLVLAVVALLPFEHIPTIDVAGFTLKLSYVVLLVLIPMGLWQYRDMRFVNMPAYEKLLVGFAGTALLAQIWSPDLRRTVVIGVLWFAMIMVFFILRRIFSDAVLRSRAADVLIMVSVVVCLFAVYQFFADIAGIPSAFTGLRPQYQQAVLGFPRAHATALEPLYLASFLLVPLFLSLARHIATGRYRYCAAAVLILSVIIIGVSRGALLALTLTLPIFAVTVIRGIGWNRLGIQAGAKILAVVLVSLGISVGMIGVALGAQGITRVSSHAQVDDASIEGGSVDSRLDTYTTALRLFEEAPVFGRGPGSVGPLTVKDDATLAEQGYGLINNQYLELLVEVGLVGLVAYLAFLFALLFSALRSLRQRFSLELVALIIGCVAMFIQYNFFSTLYILHMWVFLAWTAAAMTKNGDGA
jgi:O-antigen ligase